jgi:hypothetical protein
MQDFPRGRRKLFDQIKQAYAYLQLLALVPAIIETVKSLESGISGPGQGEAKLKALLEIVKLIWEMVPVSLAKVLKFEQIEAFVTKTVGVIVSVFNDTGVFQKGAK